MSEAGTATVTSLRERAAEEVRATLGRRRMSATELARKMGVSQTYVWRRLSGETSFDLDDLEKIAGVLNVSVLDLLPRPSEGHVVYVGGTQRQTTQPYIAQPKGSSPLGRPKRTAPPKTPAVRPSLRRTGRVSRLAA